MIIEYLTRLEKIEVLRTWRTEGLSIEEIEKLEQKYNQGNAFPKVYREYLFIAGEHSGIGLDKAFGFDWLQKTSRETLKEYNQTIHRPFFVIDQLDSCEQFGFFYLDEQIDDPAIYNCNPFEYVEYGEPLFYPYKQKRLSTFIDTLIDEALANEEFFGQYDSDDA